MGFDNFMKVMFRMFLDHFGAKSFPLRNNDKLIDNEETGENLIEISIKYGHLVAQYCYLKFRYIARILAFENATILAPKIITFIFKSNTTESFIFEKT